MRLAVDGVEHVLGYSSPDVCRSLLLPSSTLNLWVKDDLVVASLLESTGRRSTRYWTPEDYVLIRLVQSLRAAGCSYGVIGKVRGLLEEAWSELSENDRFLWSGDDLIKVTPLGEAISMVRRPGQQQIHFFVSDIGAWLSEAKEKAVRYDKRDHERLRALRAAVRSPDPKNES